MSDVSAVVLSIGEKTTQRTIDSLKRQTLQPKEIILVKNVKPSYRAGNLGASKVKTEFLTVVGSDIILDEDFIEIFRNYVSENVGIVQGHLRDPIMGRIVGIRLYRKKCFEIAKMPNTISPDVDFKKFISKRGWLIINALRFHGESKKLWHTFGEHRPDYTASYTFSKFKVEGRRYRYRKALGGMIWMMKRLKHSKHEMSLLALTAMCHGIFMKQKTDMLKPYKEGKDFKFMIRFLESSGSYDIEQSRLLKVLSYKPSTIFKNFYKLGINLRKADSFPAFKYCLDLLNESDEHFVWIAKVALCHGLFSKYYSDKTIKRDYELLKELFHD